MRKPILVAFLAALASALLATTCERPATPARTQAAASPAPAPASPVFVVMVADRAAVAEFRKSVEPGRVVAANADAVALDEGRVVTARGEGVGAVLAKAGWTDRPIEIWSPGRRDAAQPAAGGGVAGRPASGPASVPGRDVNTLAKKPTLTPGEAMAALQQLQ